MRSDRFNALLLLLMTVVLAARFLSRTAPRAVLACSEWGAAAQVWLCDHDAAVAAGRRLLEKGETSAARELLTRTLESNPLDATAYLLLGHAGLYGEAPRERDFEQGILELRAAARLGRSRPRLAAETGMQLLAQWPLLEKPERAECRDLLTRGMAAMDRQEAGDFVAAWWRYSRDNGLLSAVLESRPQMIRPAADTLTAMGAPLIWRWRLLAADERLVYAGLRREYSQSRLSVSKLENLWERMESLVGYGRLADSADSDWERYREFREGLLLQALTLSARQYRHRPDAQGHAETLRLLQRVLRETRTADLIPVEGELREAGLWAGKYEVPPLLRARLALRTGNQPQALELALETARNSRPGGGEFISARLLAARAAMVMKLMIAAEEQVQQILVQDPDHMEALCLMGIIRRELRQSPVPGEAGPLRGECRLNISGNRWERDLPLAPGMRPLLEIPPAQTHRRRLLHLRVDGRVLLERYVAAAGERISVSLKEVQAEEGEVITVIALLTDSEQSG